LQRHRLPTVVAASAVGAGLLLVSVPVSGQDNRALFMIGVVLLLAGVVALVLLRLGRRGPRM
jgi:drug/metabolite transporter (DMT)-like permease